MTHELTSLNSFCCGLSTQGRKASRLSPSLNTHILKSCVPPRRAPSQPATADSAFSVSNRSIKVVAQLAFFACALPLAKA